MKNRDIQKLAERNGLFLSDEMSFNDMGIDFKVGFATDKDGTKWLLRIPRRPDLVNRLRMRNAFFNWCRNTFRYKFLTGV